VGALAIGVAQAEEKGAEALGCFFYEAFSS
jgi:hypothetical protein